MVELLDARITRLEQLLRDADDDAVEGRIGQIDQSLRRLQQQAPHLTELAKEFPTFLEDGALSLPTQDTATARCLVILASVDRLRKQAGLFERVSSLQGAISTERLVQLQGMQGQVAKLVASTSQLGDMSLAQQEQLFELLAHYDRFMDQISQQFLIWDALVVEAERKQAH